MVNVEKVPYKSIEVETEVGIQTISSGNKITFIVEDTGESKVGIVTGFKGTKPEKVEIEFIPSDGKHKETWSVLDISEGSLRLVEEDDGSDDGEDSMDDSGNEDEE